MAFLPWSPLGGADRAAEAAARTDPVADAAAAHGVSPQRVALAWLLALSPAIVPIPGARSPEHAVDSARSVDVVLTTEEVEEIDRSEFSRA